MKKILVVGVLQQYALRHLKLLKPKPTTLQTINRGWVHTKKFQEEVTREETIDRN